MEPRRMEHQTDPARPPVTAAVVSGMRADAGTTMEAYIYERFGSADVLELRQVDMPTIGDNEVLVQVLGTAVDHGTWLFMVGEPFLVRLMAGPFGPRVRILGVDLAGRVEAVGRNVTRFRPGDAVYGEHEQTFAQYVAVPQQRIALKPSNLSFGEAAAVPVSGLTALQGLRDHARVQPGQKVLINGASGGVGTFAVQVGRVLGAEVTAVCSSRNADLVRSLGADHVIDYTREDFTAGHERWDVIFDLVGNHTLSECRGVLTGRGALLPSAGPPAPTIRRMIGGMLLSPFVSQRIVTFVGKPVSADLDTLRELIEAGEVTPVIDQRYDWRELPEALRAHGEGHARGKKVIQLSAE